MKPYSDKFFSDLARLIRHGPEPFDRLIADLSDPDRRQSLIDALSEMSRIASERNPTGRSMPKPNAQFSYGDIQIPHVPNADSEITDMLLAIREKLTVAPNLKSRRAMEELAHQINAPVARKDSIPRMIQKMLMYLSTRNADEIAKALHWIKMADRGSTESFMDLASFITRSPANS